MDNFLSGAVLDRSALLRRDTEWLRIAFQDPAARVLCYCEGDPLIRGGIENPEPVLLGMERNARSFEEVDAVFLGIEEGAPVFAMDVGNAQAVDSPMSALAGVRTDFREVAALLSRPAGALLACGRALLLWHARHPCCSLCG